MKLQLQRKSILLGALLALGLLPGAAPVLATENINLTAIDGYPTKALWVKEFIDFYIPEVDKRLARTGNYKITWNQAFGGQIVKPRHVLEGLQKGLGDIGIVTTVFHADKVPLQMIAYATPFVSTNPDLVAKTIDELANTFPEMKAAWANYNQVYLTNAAVFDTYQMFFKDEVTGLAGFNGKKIAGAGLNLRYLQGLGAAGVGGSSVTYYNKLQTGVVDGAMLWPEGAVNFKLYEVAPYMLDARIGTANSKALTVNADTWKRLPEEVRVALQEVALEYRDHLSRLAMDMAAKSQAEYLANGGKINVLSDAERMTWAKTMPNVAKEWAAGLEEKGVPANKVLARYMDIMRTNNQPILRHWDRE